MSGTLMSHNFNTIDFIVIFATNVFVPAISDDTFVSAIIHNTFIHNIHLYPQYLIPIYPQPTGIDATTSSIGGGWVMPVSPTTPIVRVSLPRRRPFSPAAFVSPQPSPDSARGQALTTPPSTALRSPTRSPTRQRLSPAGERELVQRLYKPKPVPPKSPSKKLDSPAYARRQVEGMIPVTTTGTKGAIDTLVWSKRYE